MKRSLLLVPFLVLACDDPAEVEDRCNLAALPLQGSAAAPAITDVALEVQPSGIVVLATAIDDQDDMTGVIQSIGVFRNAQCTGTPIVLQDDLAGSGLEESFGTAVSASTDAALYAAIAAAESWPVSVDFRDSGGARTTGRVAARVIAP